MHVPALALALTSFSLELFMPLSICRLGNWTNISRPLGRTSTMALIMLHIHIKLKCGSWRGRLSVGLCGYPSLSSATGGHSFAKTAHACKHVVAYGKRINCNRPAAVCCQCSTAARCVHALLSPYIFTSLHARRQSMTPAEKSSREGVRLP